ncbi:ATP-dependent DNA helicase RecQ [uncultured Clostridium sp.]|nr:ATP-dependent DNA helicase RecQ [uncultured Clostridium sp.]
MLKRAIKVLTNKPTEITGPVFTKEYNKENKQITDLENLLKVTDENTRKSIERDIKKLKYGQIGENNVYYELKNSFIPMVCLHDLRIEYKGMVAQIDFIAITSKYIYVIECKNLVGNIKITKDGEFIRSIKNSYGKVVSTEGMYSPIVQNERHINIIKEILKEELKYKFKLTRIESLIVTGNPKTIINKKDAPKSISEKIIRHDQLIERIQAEQKNKKIDWTFIEEDMMNISECLMKYHKEITYDYDKKYSMKSNDKIDIKVKSEDELRSELKSYRLAISKKEEIKPFMVFNNETMEELISNRPKDLDELKNIKGFGTVKCEKYGTDLVAMML